MNIRPLMIVLLLLPALLQAQTLDEAVSRVKAQEQGKILSAYTENRGGRTQHVIKVLTPDGKVKAIRVPVRASERGREPRDEPQRGQDRGSDRTRRSRRSDDDPPGQAHTRMSVGRNAHPAASERRDISTRSRSTEPRERRRRE